MEDVKKNKKIGEIFKKISRKHKKFLSFLASISRIRLNIKKLIQLFFGCGKLRKIGKGRSTNRKQILRRKKIEENSVKSSRI